MRSQEPPTLNSYSWQFCAAQRLIIYKTWHFPSELRATLWKSFHFLLHAALQRKGHSRLRLLWPVTALKGRSAAGPAASGCKQALLGEAGAPDWNRWASYASPLHSLVLKPLCWHIQSLMYKAHPPLSPSSPQSIHQCHSRIEVTGFSLAQVPSSDFTSCCHSASPGAAHCAEKPQVTTLMRALDPRPFTDTKISSVLGKKAWAPLVSAFLGVPAYLVHPLSMTGRNFGVEFLKQYFFFFFFFAFHEIRALSAAAQLTAHSSFVHRKKKKPTLRPQQFFWQIRGSWERSHRALVFLTSGGDCISCKGQCGLFRFQLTVELF